MSTIPAQFSIQVLRAQGLAAKDIGGTSDAFFKVGLVSADGKWVGARFKSNIVTKDLNPVWFTNRQRYELPVKDAIGVRVKVYDHDLIGSNDFLGLYDFKFSDLLAGKSSVDVHEERVVTLQPRKETDKVSGTITVKIDYTTDDFLKMQEKNKLKEREQLVKQVDASNLIPLDEVKDLAAKFQAANTAGGDTMNNPSDLANLLSQLGLWEKLRSCNVFGMGESVATVATKFDPVLREKVTKDDVFRKVTAEFLFRMFDTNHDNKVSFTEFIMGLAIHTKSNEGDRAAFYFDLFDVNGNGSISVDELLEMQNFIWRAWLAAIRGSMIFQFQQRGLHVPDDSVERIHDAISSFFTRMKLGERVVETILAKADKDKNSNLSKEEFVAFLKDGDAQEAYRNVVAHLVSHIQSDIGEEIRPVVVQLVKSGRIW